MPEVLAEILAFLHFVAGCQLHQLRDQIGVLVLGLMGAGKSTTIAVQQGAKLAAKEDGGYKIVASDVYTPRVSDGFESQTFNIGVFPDKAQKRLYFDTAGLNENRGPQELQWTRFSLATTFSLLKEISCTLVLIDYGTSIGGCRGEGLRTVAKNLCEVIGMGDTSKHFYRSMAFVITNGFFTGRPITLGKLQDDLARFKDTELRRGKAKLQSLKRGFPLPMSATAMNMAVALTAAASSVRPDPAELGSLGALMQDAHGIDFDKVPEENPDSIALNELRPVLALIDALERALAEGRVFLSFPVNAAACQQQRDSVNAMMSRCSKINKDQLKQIVGSRVTEDLDVWNVLAAAAGFFHPEVARLVDLKAQVLVAVEEKSATLKAIEQDWQKVKNHMLQLMEDERVARKDKIESLDTEIREKSNTTRRVVFKKVEVRKSKEGNWWQWMWGTQKAHHYLEYNLGDNHDPELWYKDCECSGSNFGKWEENERGPSGKRSGMSMHLGSSDNCDLSVDVYFYREEKDLPSTRARVRELQADRAELVKEQQVLNQRHINLSVCQGSDDLTRFVLERETQLKSEVQTIENKFASLIEECPSLNSAAAPPKRGHTIKALAQLLGMLTKAGAQPQILSSSSACTIEDFLSSVSFYEEQNQEVNRSAAAQAVLGEQAAVLEADARAYQEATPPVRQPFSLGQASDWAEQHIPDLAGVAQSGVKVFKPLLNFVKQQFGLNQGPLGAALAAFALCSSTLRVYQTVILALGVFCLSREVLHRVDATAAGASRALEDLRGDLRRAMLAASGQASEGYQNALDLVDKQLQGPPSQAPSQSGISTIVSTLVQYGLGVFLRR